MTNRKRWLKGAALALAALAAAELGVMLALRTRRVHDALQWRLEQAFGRPVEVSRFDVSVWSGLRVEAHYVTVAEDPRFGNEFFLRADEMAAGPDWRALLRGHVRFYRFSFDRPSLNLVAGPDGRWNFESWSAPPRSAWAGAAPLGGRPGEIVVDEGRINFKRGADKLPVSLVGVSARIAPEGTGKWRVTFEAQPLRAGVTLQDAGTVRMTGLLPGRVAALLEGSSEAEARPSEFSVAWEKASLSDALRLLRGDDFGVRGTLEAALEARGPGGTAAANEDSSRWKFRLAARLRDVHGWTLPMQAGLPAVNVSAEGDASADRTDWEMRRVTLEGPRSNLRGSGSFAPARAGRAPQVSARVVSASIHLDDLLAWYRAFHPGVAPGTVLEGYLGADVALEGWPLRIVRGTLATTGARLRVPGSSHALELDRAVVEADPRGVRLTATRIAPGGDDPGFRIAARAAMGAPYSFESSLAGGINRLEEVFAAANALGLAPPAPAGRGFTAAGGITARLQWKGTAKPWRVEIIGALGLENATLRGGVLREEVKIEKLRADFRPQERRIQVGAAEAFGAQWSGTLHAMTLAGPWEFSVAADRVNPASLIRGLTGQPPEAESLLSRVLPAQAAATVAQLEPAWPGWLRGAGTVTVATLTVGRLEMERVKGRLAIGERTIGLEGAEAEFFGGRVRGEARASFGEQPRYAVRADLAGVNLAGLAGVAVTSRQSCTGTATGRVTLEARGWNRDALLASLTGTGHADLRGAALLGFDLPASLEAGSLQEGRTPVRAGTADFSFSSGHLALQKLVLESPAGALQAKGTVSYRGELDVSVGPQARGGIEKPATVKRPGGSRGLRITGTLVAPRADLETARTP